jgi:type I restriction enzyme S subunit
MELKRGVAQLNLSLKNIGDFKIPVPPIAEQRRYVQLVERSDKSKFELQKALDELTAMQKKIIEQNLT